MSEAAVSQAVGGGEAAAPRAPLQSSHGGERAGGEPSAVPQQDGQQQQQQQELQPSHTPVDPSCRPSQAHEEGRAGAAVPGTSEPPQQEASAEAGAEGGGAAGGQVGAVAGSASDAAGGAAGDAEAEEALQEQARADALAVERAEALKREGNDLFGRGQFAEAAGKYDAALEAAPPASPVRAVFFANLAACNIKLKQYTAAVQSCTEAVRLDPAYQKAYMRRCEAFEQLDELDHALADAKKLQELCPDSEWARAKIAKLEPLVAERTEKLKNEMLGKLKDLGNTILGKFGLSTDNFKFDKDPTSGSYNIRFER